MTAKPPRVYFSGSKVFIRWDDENHPMWTTVTHYPQTNLDDRLGWSLRPPARAVELSVVPTKSGRRGQSARTGE